MKRKEFIFVCFLVPVVVILSQIFNEYLLGLLCQVTIFALVGMGLNILTGNAGLISIAHAAFMGVGAFSAAYLTENLGLPFLLAIIFAGLITSVVGIFFGFPSLRLKGIYLAMSSFAAQVILYWVFEQSRWLTGGQDGLFVDRPTILGFGFMETKHLYLLILGITLLGGIINFNILRSRFGRAFGAVRERSIAAKLMGVNVFRTKMVAFGISTFYAGVAGALFGYFLEFVAIQAFDLLTSIQLLAMVIIGGLGKISGSILGALFIVAVPELLDNIVAFVWKGAGAVAPVKMGFFGLIIVVFLVFEPNGLARIWRRLFD